MNDLQINRALALAIGWRNQDVEMRWGHVYVFGGYRYVRAGHGAWRIFDHTDPGVIWPIAERYNCFPMRYHTADWGACLSGFPVAHADTAAKAVALAVIRAGGER